jgi:predicted nucleotide-binding protein (sugar kinase/HSP70/actin superfamily)
MMDKTKILSFPHIGDYYVPIAFFAKNLFNMNILKPKPITKKTLEIGSKYSPDFVCVPFKYNLGNFIESLESGANVLIQAGGGCRFGYYAEVQEQILRDLGYNFRFINIISTGKITPLFIYREFKKINPKLNVFKFGYYFYLTVKVAKAIEEIQMYINENSGFEVNKNSFELLYKKFLKDIEDIKNLKELNGVNQKYKDSFKNIPIKKPKDCLRIGIVGEVYIALEPFSNCYIEKHMAQKGVEVTRLVTATHILLRKKRDHRQLLISAGDYLKYAIGADGTDSVAKTKEFAEKGYDGVIHIKPFACTPEVNAVPIIQRISKDYNIPVLYLSFDSQTSEAGVMTRLEAFHDMLLMRRG